MTLILAAETDLNRYMVALSIPVYRPSIMLGVIGALILALMGLAVDVMLFPSVGTMGLPLATVALGVTVGVLAHELRRALCCANPRF